MPTSPHAASLSVPSPASTTTTSTPALCRLARQLPRVAALGRLDDFDVVLGRERFGDRHPCARRHPRSDRVDDQLEAHRGEPYPYDHAGARPERRPTARAHRRDRRLPRVPAARRVARARRRRRSAPRFATRRTGDARFPGFGDPAARVLIAGLAPAAHGGNRTGRVFTGDRSGDWLFGSLHRLGFANQPTSVSVDDGLELRDAYVAAAVRCAPPDNKPTPAERDRCLPYLQRELALLDRVRVVVVLGGFAYEALARVLAACGSPLPVPRPKFGSWSRSAHRTLRGARLLPPESAEHVHRPAHRADDRRRLSPGTGTGRRVTLTGPSPVAARERR